MNNIGNDPVRINSFLFEGLDNEEIKAIEHVMDTQSPLVDKIASMLQEKLPPWNELINECVFFENGHRLLLAASIKGRISKELTVTGLNFLDHILHNPSSINKIRFYDEPHAPDFANLSDNQKFAIANGRWPESSSFEISIRHVGRYQFLKNELFQLKPMFGLSTRRGLILNLYNLISDVGLPIPGKKLFLHGMLVDMNESIDHDITHAYIRSKQVEELGLEKYRLLLDHALLFEDFLENNPSNAPSLTNNTFEPMLKDQPTFDEKIFYLINFASGQIVDGNITIPFEKLDRESIKKILNAALVNYDSLLLGLVDTNDVYKFEDRDILIEYAINLLEIQQSKS